MAFEDSSNAGDVTNLRVLQGLWPCSLEGVSVRCDPFFEVSDEFFLCFEIACAFSHADAAVLRSSSSSSQPAYAALMHLALSTCLCTACMLHKRRCSSLPEFFAACSTIFGQFLALRLSRPGVRPEPCGLPGRRSRSRFIFCCWTSASLCRSLQCC